MIAELQELGWSKGELAERLGVEPETVYRWHPAPKYVEAYLRMALQLKRVREVVSGVD